MFGKKNKAEKQQQEQNIEEVSVLDWESNIIDLVQKSERRAWLVAKMSAVGFILSVVSIGLLMPLKETRPYVIRVDKTTGGIDLVTSVRGKDVTNDEVQDKYFVNQLVINREGYDWHTLKNSYLITRELSSDEVFKPFEALYQSKNAPNNVYGDKYAIKIEVISITIQDGDTAVVRFAKVKTDTESNHEIERTNWTATIGFKYSPEILATENQRLINPFGFTAVSYQVVPEINSIPTSGK